MAKPAKRKWPKKLHPKGKLFGAKDKRCRYCKLRLTNANATMDHVIPKSRGGHNGRGNLVLCCERCNRAKGSKTPEEFMEALELGEIDLYPNPVL